MRILMVAAENGALPGGKVGGMADVLAQVPPALIGLGHAVDVLIPSYGIYQNRADARLRGTVSTLFAGIEQRLGVYELAAGASGAGQWVLHHPLFGQPPGQIYHHDDSSAPFATDANLYALFCAGVAACIEQPLGEPLGEPFWPGLEVLHLHDWHAAGVLLFLPREVAAGRPRTVFSIHNLALQGQRPLTGPQSSFIAWFGDRICPPEALDPRYPDCYNPMRLGISLADRVHTVSPSYAREILQPNGEFHHGGEGLEEDLRRAAETGRLHGILNGCDYDVPSSPLLSPDQLWTAIEATLAKWIASNEFLSGAHYLAHRNLGMLRAGKRKTRPMVLTCVGRLVSQKIGLLQHPVSGDGRVLLDRMLESVSPRVVLVVLGTGALECERFLVEMAGRHPNLIYLRGFDDNLARSLYDNGDLFLMPSVFEPCGISQMLAMRGRQPCLVHATGGLSDTVLDDVNGFSFSGDSAAAAAEALAVRFSHVVELWKKEPESWNRVRKAAASSRFEWRESARRYIQQLYQP